MVVHKGLSLIHIFAVNTGNPKTVKKNIEMATKQIPKSFWLAMKEKGLLEKHYEVN